MLSTPPLGGYSSKNFNSILCPFLRILSKNPNIEYICTYYVTLYNDLSHLLQGVDYNL